MDPKEIMKQMIMFNKSVFDNAFNAITIILEERDKAIGMYFEHAPWFPEEGRRIVNEWIKSYKKGRSDFKAAIDDNFQKIDDYFLRDDKKKSGK